MGTPTRYIHYEFYVFLQNELFKAENELFKGGDNNMGMWDKDKSMEHRLTETFEPETPFILWGASIGEKPISTKFGPADVAYLTCSEVDSPDDKLVCGTLAAAIISRLRDAEPDDFPAVVCHTKAPSSYGGEAVILKYVGPYERPAKRGSKAPSTA